MGRSNPGLCPVLLAMPGLYSSLPKQYVLFSFILKFQLSLDLKGIMAFNSQVYIQ